MATTKVSDLTALGVAPDATDEIIIVDKSDTTQAVSGTTKKVAFSDFTSGLGGIGSFSGDNTAISSDGTALSSLTVGARNVAIGDSACASVTTSSDNIAIGESALSSTTGQGSIGIGNDAFGDSTGSYCVGIGQSAGRYATTGNSNIAIGQFSCGGNNGALALTGANNVAIGLNAGRLIQSTSASNVFIGSSAGQTNTIGSNNINIGNVSNSSSATVSNEITLGNASITTLRCAQTSITAISDGRDKTNVTPLDAGLNLINELNPVKFNWALRYDPETEEAPAKNGVPDIGFIAQDLQQAQINAGVTIPKLVFDVNPDRLEATYGHLLPVMIKALQELSTEVETLKARVAVLEAP